MHALVYTAIITISHHTYYSLRKVSHFTNNYTAMLCKVHDPYFKVLKVLQQDQRISQTMQPCIVDGS
jgi:hypothetical protein